MKHLAPISGIACLKGRHVATAGYDDQLILWDGLSRVAIQRAFHDHLANQCAFSPDGRFLASASSDYTARLYDVPAMRLRTVFDGHEDDIEMIAFSGEGSRVATCSRDGTLRVFALDGTCLAVMRGHEADVISVGFAPGDAEIISSSDDATVRRWSAETGKEISKVVFDDVETDALAITPDGLVIAGNDEGQILTIDGDDVQTVQAHDAGIKRLVYDAQGKRLVSLSYDRKMCLWTLQGCELVLSTTAALPDVVWPRSCAFFDDTTLVFATFGSTFAIYDIPGDRWDVEGIEPSISINAVLPARGSVWTIGDAGILKRDGIVAGETGSLCNFLVELDGRIVSGGQMGRVFDAESGAVLHQHRSPLNCGASFVKDGLPHVAVGAYTGEIVVLRSEGDEIRHVASLPVHRNAIKGIASDGERLFTVAADCSAALTRISDFETEVIWEDGHDKIANGCAALGPGAFASISRDLCLRIWSRDGATGHRSPHVNSIKCVATDGRYIATGSYGGVVAVFDLETGRWVLERRLTGAGLSCLVATDGPGAFLASAYDGAVYSVDVPAAGAAKAA